MKNKKEVQEYFENKYYNEKDMYNSIIDKIKEDKDMPKRTGILKIIATILIAILGTTGIVLASTKIYNEYIKKQGQTEAKQLFLIREGPFEGTYSSNYVHQNMIYSEEARVYYKIITNITQYNEYKNKVNELPEITETDFNNNFIIIIVKSGIDSPHRNDLTISNINADETKSYITLKQKENPNYDKAEELIYALVDKSLLREEVEIKFIPTEIKNANVVPLDKLKKDYSKEDAIKDGCFVIDDGNVLSQNKYALDEIIEKSQNNVECYLRIFYTYNGTVKIYDLQYNKEIFILKVLESSTSEISTYSFKYLIKQHIFKDQNIYSYGYNNDNQKEYMTPLFNIKI